MKKLSKKAIIAIIIAALFVVAGTIVLTTTIISCNNNYATVSFQTEDGSKVAPIKVKKGSTLTNVPFSEKRDYTFTGWYSNETKTESFFSSAPINNDITLYASFVKNNDNLKLAKKTNEYLEDCPKNMSLTLKCASEITADNLASYIEFSTMTGELPKFSIEKAGDEYKLSAVGGFLEGGMFTAKLSAAVTLVRVERGETTTVTDYSAIREISFRIHRENFHEVKALNGIKTVDSSFVVAFSDIDYKIPTALGIAVGDTVLIGSKNDANSRYVKILSVTPFDSSNSIIKVQDCSIDEVYEEVDVYQKDSEIANLKLGQKDTVSDIKKALYASEGTKEFTARLAKAYNNSETIQRALDGDIVKQEPKKAIGGSFADNAYFTDSEEFTVDGLVEGLSISVKLGNAENTNFERSGTRAKNWTALGIKFAYEVTLKEKITIKASLSITEYLAIAMCAQEKKSGLSLKFNYALDVFTQTDINFSVELRTASDKESLNISDEIEGLIKGEEESETGLASQMKDFLDNDRNYIELLKVDLFTTAIGVPSPPIFAINIDFSFVVKIDFSARLSGTATILDARQIGMYGDTATGIIKTYDNDIFGTGRSSYDIFAVGRLGVRAGLQVTLSISFYGLRSLGEIGIEGELGVQFDIYGFMHYTFKNDKFAEDDYGGTIESTLTGGVYFEVSLYMEVSLFASSDIFKAKAEVVIFEYQIPLFSLGNKSILVKLDDIDNTNFLMREEKAKLASIPTLKGTYMDITTGEEESNIRTDPKDLSVQFTCPFFKYDFDTDEICLQKENFGIYEGIYDISRYDKMVSADMNVFYRGQSLMFHSGSGANAYPRLGTINLVWADPTLDFNESDIGKAVKATFQYESDGVTYPLGSREVFVGQSVGGVDLTSIIEKYVVLPNGSSPDIGWNALPDNTTITEDTTFTYRTKRKQAVVGFLYNNGLDWTADVKAVNLGDTPTAPEIITNDKLIFKQWNGYPSTSVTSREYGSTFSGVREVKTDTFGFSSIYLTGLDTTVSVSTFSGSQEKAMDYIISNVGVASGGAYYYYANYEFSFVDITFEIIDIDGKEKSLIKPTAFGISPYPSEYECLTEAGSTLLGWDSFDDNNYDGAVDYAFKSVLPLATTMQTYKAVYERQTLDVFVYDISGKQTKFSVPYGADYPDIVYLAPEVIQKPGEEYRDVHWEMKYNIEGKDDLYYWSGVRDTNTKCWYSVSFYAVASHNYLCTFNADGGKVGGEDSVKLSAKAGVSVPISGKNGILKWQCVKDTNEKNYKLKGWRDEAGKEYAIDEAIIVTKHKVFTAIYTETDKIYNINVSTEHGVLLNDKKVDSFSGKYASYLTFIQKYDNYAPNVANEVDKVWSFSDKTKSVDELTTTYVFNWTSKVRNYVVTLNLDNGEENTQQTLAYNSVYHFAREYYDKPADQTNFYELLGWDINGDGVSDIGALWGDEHKPIIVKSDMTIKAIWRATTQTRTIKISAIFGESVVKEEKIFTGAVGSIFDKSILDSVAKEYVDTVNNNTWIFTGWSEPIPDTFNASIDQQNGISIVADYKLKDFTITINLIDELSNISKVYMTIQVGHSSLMKSLEDYGVPARPKEADGKNFSGWKLSDGGNIQVGTQINNDIVIKGTITTFYVTYSLNGAMHDKKETLIGDVVTLLPNVAGYTKWNTADIVVSGETFTMPDRNIYFVANTDISSGNLNVSYGGAVSNIDTLAKSGANIINDYFNYYSTDGVLYIKKSGVTLSGVAKDIMVIVSHNVNVVTLKDAKFVSLGNREVTFDSGILLPTEREQPKIDYNDALIYSLSEDLTIFISGKVVLHKVSDNGNTIVSNPNKEVLVSEVKTLTRTYGILKVVGTSLSRATDSLSLIADANGIDGYGDIKICDITLDVISRSSAIDVREADFRQEKFTDGNLTLNNIVFNTKYSAHGDNPTFYNSVGASGDITIIDSKLNVTGTINGSKKMTIKGRSFGDISSMYGTALYACNQNVNNTDGRLEIALYKDFALNVSTNSVTAGAIELGMQDGFTLTKTISQPEYMISKNNHYYILTDKLGEFIKQITFTGKN